MSERNKMLLVDVGNTRIKYLRDREIFYAESFEDLPLSGVDEVRVATVSRHDEIKSWMSTHSIPVRLARVKKHHQGLSVAYTDVARLGVDRWLAMLTKWVEGRSSFTVIDLGTAITVDNVDSEGIHCGGYIVPGFRLMKEALGLNTAQVGFGGESGRQDYGKNTEDCVDHGINRLVNAFVASVASDKFKGDSFVLTGGDVQKLDEELLGKDCEIDETLVIRGLRYCFE